MSRDRIAAMRKQCKRLSVSASCGCEVNCKLAIACVTRCGELGREIGERQAEIDWLSEIVQATEARSATVRDGWKRPSPPDVGYFLKVINDGGGWCLHWHSDSHDTDCIVIEWENAWPFNEETAYARDWQALGVEVV